MPYIHAVLNALLPLPRKAQSNMYYLANPFEIPCTSHHQNESKHYKLKTKVTNFSFALCPTTAEINTAFLQESTSDFPRSTSSSYRLVNSSCLGSPLPWDQECPAYSSFSASFLEVGWTIWGTEKLSVHLIMAFVIRSPGLDCSTPENSPPKAFETG